MSYWVIIYRFSMVLLGVLFAVGLVCIFLPKCHSLQELHRRKAAIEEENRQTAVRVRELRTKQQQFSSDPSFVELTAREMGMARTNETVFRLSDPETGPAARAPQ